MRSEICRLLPASGIRAIFERAIELERAGRKIIHLDIGRPDWKLPPGAAPEITRAVEEGFVHYIPNRGLRELREILSNELFRTTTRRYDVDRELIVTSGGSEGLAMTGLALLGPGDEVIIPEPAWPHYRAVAGMAGATVVPMPLSPETGYLIDPEQLECLISPRTKLVVVNSPSNPTGAIQPRDRLQAIATLAEQHGFFVLSDEVYSDFVFAGEPLSLATLMGESDRLILLNSLSKSYAMTSWRIGYVAAAPAISDALNRVHQYLTVCGVAFAQRAAAKLLVHPELPAYRAEMQQAFQQRFLCWRDAFAGLAQVSLTPPQGAFYVFPRIDYRGMTGRAFCQFMLEEQGVATVPGDVFGEAFAQHIRISYGGSLATQEAGVAKFKEVLHD